MGGIPQSGKFLANVLEATLKGPIPWEETADPDILSGQLEGDYSLRLEQVPDFDHESQEAPDYVLSLRKARRAVLAIDRRDFSREDIKANFSEGYEYAHDVFVELWRYANAKATKIDESLNEANQILNRMITK